MLLREHNCRLVVGEQSGGGEIDVKDLQNECMKP